jgi:hypothetical protein
LSAKVNLWTEKTLKLAEGGDYLDKLLEVYPAELLPERPLPEGIRKEIRDLYVTGKYEDLVIRLLDLRHPFPIEHPYAALLRHLDRSKRISVIKRNPQIIKVLANLLASLGLNNIIKGIERPKDINRVLGAAFRNWVRNKFIEAPFRIVDESHDLLRCNSDREICIFTGSDIEVGSFIRESLRLEEPRERFFNRDILVNVRNTFILGEARFLSTPGGSQSRDLDNAITFVETMEKISASAKSRGVKIKGIALLDGIVWFYGEYVKTIKRRAVGDVVVMSALFLKEYLLSLFNKIS